MHPAHKWNMPGDTMHNVLMFVSTIKAHGFITSSQAQRNKAVGSMQLHELLTMQVLCCLQLMLQLSHHSAQSVVICPPLTQAFLLLTAVNKAGAEAPCTLLLTAIYNRVHKQHGSSFCARLPNAAVVKLPSAQLSMAAKRWL